jgi:hypothetical protein
MKLTILDRLKYRGKRQEIFDWCTETFGPGEIFDVTEPPAPEDLPNIRWASIVLKAAKPEWAPIYYGFSNEADRTMFELRWA